MKRKISIKVKRTQCKIKAFFFHLALDKTFNKAIIYFTNQLLNKLLIMLRLVHKQTIYTSNIKDNNNKHQN